MFMSSDGANVYDILRHDTLVLTKEAVENLTKRLGQLKELENGKRSKTCSNLRKNLHTLKSPIVTEKSMMGSQNGQVTFRVPVETTKPEIKAAVEALV
jgi:hypothetical protein